jgi:predicted transposase YbfD/YdcC
VLAQTPVAEAEYEIRAAPRLLRRVNLRGKLIRGDAMLAQKDLCARSSRPAATTSGL